MDLTTDEHGQTQMTQLWKSVCILVHLWFQIATRIAQGLTARAKIKIRIDGFRVVTIFDGGNLTKLARQKKSFDRPPYG